MKFNIGLIINPVAGLGGAVALKGSDGVAEQALSLGAVPKSTLRCEQAFTQILSLADEFVVTTVTGAMGADMCKRLGLNYQLVTFAGSDSLDSDILSSTSDHTLAAASAIKAAGVDCLVFTGGDGTARNVYSALGDNFPVLGIPAGVKIHSGVYAISPVGAGEVLKLMLTNQLVSVMERDVMDIDEALFRQGSVKAKRYGEMLVPAELRYMQAVKMGGKESDELVLGDIAADVIEQIEDALVIMGSGSTTEFVMQEMGLENTLLGVDVIYNEEVLANDVTETQLYDYVQRYEQVKLVITLIGGQGHIFGRGNQQLSPRVIRAVGLENIIVIATKTKLNALAQRPLLADTGDTELDRELSGMIKVTTGFHDYVMVRLQLG